MTCSGRFRRHSAICNASQTRCAVIREDIDQPIRQQQAPDGTPYAPRKAKPIEGKKGRVKRQMFQKLRTAKYLKAKDAADAASVEFVGRVQRMARVHHYGLRDRPSDDVQYEARQLLGFSKADIKTVDELLIEHLSQ
ncbi:phage virion morphogenesis protein [Brenneria izadpanahii]|uniref:Phage virion morphogenesis protein n=1 Tax=Brenneria izadpanahii TaxID=2722756 RepID=A0ABX7UZL3_9GAMM|nr:phage virion morphogenesis protein [Brenneria izadpanahii]